MVKKVFWDKVKKYIDAKTTNLSASIVEGLNEFDWDAVTLLSSDPEYTALMTAALNAEASQLKAWESEASKLTSSSYADESFGAFVKLYTSDGLGGFPYTITADYSALHWAKKAENATIGISYQAPWTPSSGYPTTSATGLPLATGMMWVVDTAETFDSIDWKVDDQLLRNAANNGWDRLVKAVEWSTINGVPDNVTNALSTLGGTMTGHIVGVTSPLPTSLVRRDWVEAQVVDNLTTNSGTVPLSAKQGKVLNEEKVNSNIVGITGAVKITNMVSMTQAAYDALGSHDASTYYVIVG